ncbi:MAG: flavin prenyltransferase UbiX [Thiobacillaceae bacterium]
MPEKTITLAFTGASGMAYGLRLLECLVEAGAQVNLLTTQAAHIVAKQELALTLPNRPIDLEKQFAETYRATPGQLKVYGRDDWFAPVASGSARVDAMVVCPCSMGTLAAIANGASDNLIERAADVMLKEQRKLILVPRETPFSTLHLENMLRLARMNTVILPANPGFYHLPQTVQDVVDFVVARILDQLNIDQKLFPSWGRP